MEIESIKNKAVLDDLFDGLSVLDEKSQVVYWNRSAERLSGYESTELIGNKLGDKVRMFHADMETPITSELNPINQTLFDGQMRESDLFLSKNDGTKIPVSIKVTPIHSQSGKIIGAVQLLSDNTVKLELVSQVKELQRLAMFDSLTELGNRRFALRNMDSMFNEFKRYNHTFGLLFFDIDHFKAINDNYGHDVGDKVLKIVADTLKNSVRSFDNISRWGGEEFIGLIKNVEISTLERVANKLRLAVVQSSLMENDQHINVSISIGGTLAREIDDMNSLVDRADKLMYKAKNNGRNCVFVN